MLFEWWWLFLVVDCVWIFKTALYIWYFWRKQVFDARLTPLLLEIKIPEEVLEPVKAMETVITGFWQICSPPNWYEKWWEGQSSYSFTLEIAGIDGVPHFYVRMTDHRFRAIFESHIYSQYPTAEISEAEDYTKNVPQDIPNEQWELWGTEYCNLAHWAYPIKTYVEFETGREEEEKRIDPIASLLEGIAKLQKGEQAWIQIRCFPILPDLLDWKPAALKFRDKLAWRKVEDVKSKPMLQEAAEILLTGNVPELPKKEVESFIPMEMKLTPGEREVILALERKMGKLAFLCSMKWIYLAKRDVFFKPKARLIMSYFTNFVTDNMNGLVPLGATITKITKHWYDWFWFINRRLFVRKRRLFRASLHRIWTRWPADGFKTPADKKQKRFVLNAEELASLYHFPGREAAAAPTMLRVEAKKGEPPSELPVG